MSVGAVTVTLLALWVGAWTAGRQQQAETAALAQTYTVRADKVGAAAALALTQVEGVSATDCTDTEIARLRRIVLTSPYLKSASRVRDGRMYCTSTIGRVEPPALVAPADFVGDGVDDHALRISFDSPQIGVPDARALVLERGSASVTVYAQAYSQLVDPRLDYAMVAGQGAARRVLMSSGPSVPVANLELHSGGHVLANDSRYEVQCAALPTGCILATLRTPPSIFHSPVMLEFGIFGLLLGLSGGFAASSLIGRSKSLGRQLRLAMRSGKLKVAYQPIVRLSDRRTVGAEALLRWTDATGKQVSPDAFISVAEQEGFIGEITRFVVQRVLHELGDDLRQRPDFQVTVNVAASDILDGNFLPFLSARLQAAQLTPASFGLELTERTTGNSRELGRAIARLREAGHMVYIDDFGTDYSSLSYLSRLRVDAIKINRTFMQALHDQSDQDTIAPQIVAMAEVLGLSIVIEGIEEEQQAAYFLALAPRAMAQGWLFSKPVEAGRLFAS